MTVVHLHNNRTRRAACGHGVVGSDQHQQVTCERCKSTMSYLMAVTKKDYDSALEFISHHGNSVTSALQHWAAGAR